MINLESIQTSKLPIGAKAGQIVLLVDLTQTPNPIETLDLLKSTGYEPQLRFCVFATGLHIVAVLKNEQFDPSQPIDDEYLMDEWIELVEKINPDAVRLWRGHPKPQPSLV
ncbi:hypothetical protein H6G00_01040 [Leptolyngbya sp. FACHB-541]|uniref:hypothetical protein n=1 Tax=Leptolyngbya sp. FACHB-541 TaxID=2692810 RepID=UPI001685C264|nr:hypothetical protein [Leptolyngbya sp. FACHB-541]MBD1995214.1 hypothetical protein [Leptolyngbya sp. FACHB-541]